MKSFRIRTHPAGEPTDRREQLSWRLAEVASANAPIDAAAADMVGCRVIDSVAVGLAALDQDSVRTARSQALLHSRPSGARILGMPDGPLVDSTWAAWVNSIAVRELDLHDNYYGFGVAHPADAIPAILATAEQCGLGGEDLVRGILTSYEIQIALTDAIDLNSAGIDHVANLGPAIAAGIGSLLRLDTRTIFESINHMAHVSCAPIQARKGAISSWKSAAPAHVAKLALEATDRALRGQTNPAPIYEGRGGLLASMFRPSGGEVTITLPEDGEPRKAILRSYPKAHAAGYHAQAFIDLAFRIRDRVGDFEAVRSVELHTKAYTHNYLGTGSGDPEKMNPDASRETLDHSILYIFAVALEDGRWHHIDSYLPERARRPATVRLWHKVRTIEDAEWTRRFTGAASVQKDHGGRVVITMSDGTVIEDEIAVPDSHPRGSKTYGADDYARKFNDLAGHLVEPDEADRFFEAVAGLRSIPAGGLGQIHPRLHRAPGADDGAQRGLFDWLPPVNP